MALNKQIHIYSVDTSAFYTKSERELADKLYNGYKIRNSIRKINKSKRTEFENKRYTKINKVLRLRKERLKNDMANNKGSFREFDMSYINDYNIISVFESSLTRISDFKIGEVTQDMIVVRTFYFDILEDISINGFTLNGEKYVLFTASAGQIRTKKSVFIKESLWNEKKNSLTCELSMDKINEHGGINVNKYLAYLALTNSASEEWKSFDIDKTIVVDDFETTFKTKVDYIDEKTYEIHRNIDKDVTIPHMDGCGICLPKVNRKSLMVRMPWVKGLIVPFQFNSFVRKKSEENGEYCGKIKDIYEKEYDIIKDGIEVIFTKSQFKMWKYYDSWEDYKDKFKKHQCQSSYCNEEEDRIRTAKINYQMIQTLTDMTMDEALQLSEKTNSDIYKISRDRDTMLRILGVTDYNQNKDITQQILEIYPELLRDSHFREELKDAKKRLVKEGKSARLPIKGKYTYLVPDLYAFCEWMFLGHKNPKGLLQDGEVTCNLFRYNNRLDVLRSPHLYLEHAVRNNVFSDEINKWFITKGIYTSVHDAISRILQFDNDGDKSLVVPDELIVEIADRNVTKHKIVPLYYDMAKSAPQSINNKSLYNGMISAYSGGNIGAISNDITKIWNSDDINLDAIRYLCMENNFVIDYAKTLYKPERPKTVDNLIKNYTKSKTPKFFMYAKDKLAHQVEPINNSVVNMFEKTIKNSRFNFKNVALQNFDYKLLKSKKNRRIKSFDRDIIDLYDKLNRNKFYILKDSSYDIDRYTYLYNKIREELLEVNNDIDYVTDILIEELFVNRKSSKKAVLFNSFGEVIFNNLKNNIVEPLGEYILCEDCGLRIKKVPRSKTTRCSTCQDEKNKENTRLRVAKHRS